EDPLLLQEVDRHKTEGDEVERIGAEFRAPPDFLELRPVDDFQAKPEALSHLKTPLFEQRAGGRHDEYTVCKPSGHELRDHQAGLDRLSKPHGIGKKQPDSAAANGPQNRNELVGFDHQPSRLDGKQCCGPQGLLEQERLVIDQPVDQGSRALRAKLVPNRFDFLERKEKIEFLSEDGVLEPAKAKERLLAQTLGGDDLPAQSSCHDLRAWKKLC